MTKLSKEMRFQAIVMPHLNSAFNLARWLTRNGTDAEDIVQEAYLRAFTFFDSFYGEDGRAWLLTIVRNTFYTWHQKNPTQNTEFDEQSHSIDGENIGISHQVDNNPENILLQKDSQAQLLRALQALPLAFREVMVLRELEELSYKQISVIIGIPVGTVMSRLGRGRGLLQSTLRENLLPTNSAKKNKINEANPVPSQAPLVQPAPITSAVKQASSDLPITSMQRGI
ncbi:sigma-70 family RNA polymerase sigma factor [Glaciimonas sp. Gout2]|uniref:sigma-70 family RNA polymerase sigma factor n=1 Tax=unclassified Glaciimonas TaxID=2644401 RepID=UPI002AB58751|nr:MULTISPECIES: sigma-70 family RNA polymerase sigma factor [unclassified Glaciimonas]MDY7544810.1 sigma-70 family RNA polymerase sigma factor [Glaciimonas sp. CA11.2]MEB0011892.1 sigma-70 family RNA polymerase sigma factor [Glaciimonas sp. Cout2]MEB0082873.1 sigma-70 family RNA polymerase sigma factor [Glaciimonas sp. Gout2]